MAFQQIDDTAADADEPLDGLLLQDLANNAQASRDARLRRGSVCWDVRDPPIICGTYPWGSPGLIGAFGDGMIRVVQPFLWRRSSLDVTEITVRPRHTVVDGDIEVGVVVLPLHPLRGFPRDFPENAEENTETTRAAAAISNSGAGFAVDVSEIEKQEMIVCLTWRSELVGSPTGPIAATDMEIPRLLANGAALNSGGLGSTQRPCKVITLSDKTYTYTAGNIPPDKQLIFVDYNVGAESSVWVYPPFEQTGGAITYVGGGNLEFSHQTISSAALYSVEIEETAVRDFKPFQASLNPGQPDKAKAIKEACYRRDERVFLEHTRVWAMGPPSPDPELQDTNWSSSNALNPVHATAQWSSPDRSLATCYVGTTHRHDSVDGTDSKVVAYDVTALVGIAAAGSYQDGASVRQEVVRLWLTLGNPGGFSAGVTGAKVEYLTVPMVYSSATYALRLYSHPLGYLLRLHYENAASPVAPHPVSGQIAHAMLGHYPEDVWHQARPSEQRGGFIIYRGRIVDTSNSAQRKLNLWIDSETFPDPHAWAHCISWCVTTVVAEDCNELADFSVAT
jgi:hypothetical protein